MTELKPCPFCGSLEEDFRSHPEPCFLHRIAIQSDTSCMAYCKEDCEASWNTRHIPEGYALVPIYPTEEAMLAGSLAGRVSAHTAGKVFKAMIEVAQESQK